MSCGIEGAFFVEGVLEEFGGAVELGRFLSAALLLELAELFGFSFAAAAEAVFLELEIAEAAFFGDIDFEFDEAAADGGRVIGELFGEAEFARGEEGHFEAGDAVETPGGIGERLDEGGFLGSDRGEALEERFEVLLVEGEVVGGEEDGAAGESGGDGVAGGSSFAIGGGGTGGELGVGLVSGDALRGGSGGSSFACGRLRLEVAVLGSARGGGGFGLLGAAEVEDFHARLEDSAGASGDGDAKRGKWRKIRKIGELEKL